MGNSNPYQEVIRRAVQLRETKLEQQMKLVRQSASKWNISPQGALKVASLSVEQVVNLLNKGQITSEELLDALALRCSTAGKNLNIYTVTNFDKALQAAKACDLKRKETGKKNWTPEDGDFDEKKHLPPLFGIPVSLKDVFHVDGLTTTLGMGSKAQNYQPESSLVKCLKNSGAIPFVKTNLPQLGMTIETNNFLWGRTLNPWNTGRAVGGSSGGEGAVISARCSILGVGSDIGGSIRIPSEHCGVFGLKPFSQRISSSYHAVFSKAFGSFCKAVPLCIGPLGKSARDLAAFMDVATTEKYYQGVQDPYTKIIPFDWKAFKQAQKGEKKYRIGVIKSLKDIEPSHASRRALQEVIEILRKEGHEIIEIQIPQEREVIREFALEYVSSKCENYRQILQGEQPIPQYKSLFQIGQMWSVPRFFVSTLAKKFQPRPYFYFFDKKPFDSVMSYQTHMGEINALKSEWMSYWKQNRLDFTICPGFGCQAFPHGKSEKLGMAGFYTLIWNLLDMATGSMPITVVKDNQLGYQSATNDMVTTQLREVASQSLGLPVGIQVIGMPYDEQRVLGLMSNIDKKVEFYKKNPLPNV